MHSHDIQLPHISELYRPYLKDLIAKIRLFSRVRILIVVDPEISLTAGSGAFGIGRVIQLIRDTSVGCIYFDVTLARRSTAPARVNPMPAADQPKYEGFRFDRKEADGVTNTIEQFHEIWCFGFQPGNDAGPDSNINKASAVPMSDVELRVLTQWMNARQGGVFATGDHDYLGASMCHRIPRVGTMRLWTNADGVPPIGGLDRIDTNRAATPAQADIAGGSPAMMPFDNQSDAVPQPIQWVAWSKVKVARHIVKRRPHPVLCHPVHGPIDVMPDHPHEGRCFDTVRDSAGNSEIKLSGTYNFGGGVAGDEYPTVGGARPTPMVIAYGTTLPDPPYNHFKGDSPFKRFPMISVYDGHQIQLGRVVVDSTWHHWMDVNLDDLEPAPDKTNWEKISRYFINLALWLAPPGIPRRCITFHILESHFEYLGFREFSPRVSIFELGAVMKQKLHLLFGPCWVTQYVLDWIWLFKRPLYHKFVEHYLEYPRPRKPMPRPDPCLSCPPIDVLEDAILGGLVLQSIEIMKPIRDALHAQREIKRGLDFDQVEKEMLKGASRGLKELTRALDASVKYSRALFADATSK